MLQQPRESSKIGALESSFVSLYKLWTLSDVYMLYMRDVKLISLTLNSGINQVVSKLLVCPNFVCLVDKARPPLKQG